MRTIFYFLIIFCFLVFSFEFGLTPQTVAQQSEANIYFEWAFGALIGKDNNFVSITKDTSLMSGEEIKMMVKLNKECFVYIVHQGPKGEVTLLFPYSIQQFQKDYEVDKNYYIPRGRAWLKLDKTTGKERFFILASTERLLDIEAKIGDYLSAETSKKEAIAESLISEIRNARKRYSTFATIAEKPITIGGNIRGTEKVEKAQRPDVADIATKITAYNFYSKTITIDHK